MLRMCGDCRRDDEPIKLSQFDPPLIEECPPSTGVHAGVGEEHRLRHARLQLHAREARVRERAAPQQRLAERRHAKLALSVWRGRARWVWGVEGGMGEVWVKWAGYGR